MQKKATVVGAGLVGSLLSIFLARRGFKVEVFERRPDMRKAGYLGGRSINLAMSHRGWRGLEKAGIAEQMRPHALPMYGRMMHDTKGNLTYQPYGKEGEAIYSVSRGGLNEALLNVADQGHDNIQFHFEQECVDADPRTGKLAFEHTQTKVRTEVQPEYTFGTDGAYSALRAGVMRQPMFNYNQTYLEHWYKELHIPAGPNGEYLMQHDALHIWPRGNFMLIALPNSDGSFTCTLFMSLKGATPCFEPLTNDEAILEFMNTYFPDCIPLMPTLLQDFKENPTSSLVTVRCAPWNHGKFLLLGDAAHAIVPFYGQGMNCGFEDCTVLDEMFEQYGDDQWNAMSTAYSESRVPNANGIADLALRNFIEMRDLVGDPTFLLYKKIGARLFEKYPERFMPVYSMVTFSHLPYSEALAEQYKQDDMFAAMSARIPDLAQHWDGAAVEAVFQEFYGG